MKMQFVGDCGVHQDKILSNIKHSHSLGLEMVPGEVAAHDRRLAIVGGGPSISNHIEEIRGYSDIFSINGTYKFLKDLGIDSTFISVDCGIEVARFADGVTKAIVASRVAPEFFEKASGISIFDLKNDIDEGIWCGSSTATCCFHLGIELGYRDITFYGCEGSFGESSHAYRDEGRELLMWVECGGVEYKTSPDFYVQSGELSSIIKMAPKNFKERSGGLLGAMVANDDHDVTAVSRAMLEKMTPITKPS